jgi:hypothetical protein
VALFFCICERARGLLAGASVRAGVYTSALHTASKLCARGAGATLVRTPLLKRTGTVVERSASLEPVARCSALPGLRRCRST